MPSIFVTATGTEVGKTFVSAGLLRAARRAGFAVDALKPVLTGFAPDAIATSDAGVLLAAMGHDVDLPKCERVSPWRFAAPLAPDMAAARENRHLDCEAIIEHCRAFAAKGTARHDLVALIEGIGGVMVPIAGTFTVLDLIVALGCPVVLIGSASLGTISHTLCALAALAGRGILPAHLVANDVGSSSIPAEETCSTLRRFHPGLAMTSLRHGADEPEFDALFATLATEAWRHASFREGGDAA